MSEFRRDPKPRPNIWLTEALVLICEITAAAECVAAACDVDGAPIVAADPESRMLRVLGRARGRLSISDIGRSLRISRQAARKVVIAAADRGLVELGTNRHDRRLVAVELTGWGRSEREAAGARERGWAITLLNGLDVPAMRATAHILRVIRQRLQRDERAYRKASRRLAHAPGGRGGILPAD